MIYNQALSTTQRRTDISPKNLRKSLTVGAVLHSERTPAAASAVHLLGRIAVASFATLALAACGSNYRPVVSSINPVGPAGQPTKYAVAVSTTGANSPGLATLIDVSGDTIVNTTLIGNNPQYLNLAATGFEAYTINANGTLNSFSVSASLLASEVLQSTLFANSFSATNPAFSIYSQGTYLYINETGRGAVAELSGLPPGVQQELPTGPNPVYTVGANGSPRAYALVQGSSGAANGTAVPIETTSNTTDTAIPVGINPTYGVMTSDSRRAFILNKGSNSVSVINAQANALDTFYTNGCNPAITTPCAVTSTIPVGVAPVWADFAPTLSELLVANAGNGTTPGSVTIVSIPLCSSSTVPTNPNCNSANPIDAIGFGYVVANIPVGVNPVMIAVLQDGSQAFVANAGNAAAGINGSVSIINLATDTVVATIPGGASINENDNIVHGHPNFIAVTTGTPTGKAYVTAPDSNDITILRSDTDIVQTHLSLQGAGVAVRTSAP